jgi:hypothetical protein
MSGALGFWRSRLVRMVLVLTCAIAPAWANLIITPTFDTSITSDPNASIIEGTINTAIGVYESEFVNPINVGITFREGGGLGASGFNLYQTPYSIFRSHLAATATDSDDATTLAALPTGTLNPATGTDTLLIKSANAKALGYTGFTGSDGTIILNTTLTTPGSLGSSSTYSLLALVEHEIDEILGLGSTLGLELPSPLNNNPSPQDFFRFEAGGARSFTLNAATVYFSLNGTTDLVQFNNPDFASCSPNCGDYGDWASSSTVRVQDAFATVGSSPTLGLVEITGLDVIGYQLATPEPGTAALLLGGLFLAGIFRRRGAQSPRH